MVRKREPEDTPEGMAASEAEAGAVDVPIEDGNPIAIAEIPPSRIDDPAAYIEAAASAMNLMLKGHAKSVDTLRTVKVLQELCAANTGIEFADAAKRHRDPVERFAGLMESSAAELEAVERAIERLPATVVDGDVKKKWRGLIRRTTALQDQCRVDPAKCCVYICRNDDEGHQGELMELQSFHLDLYRIWNDPEHANSLIEAPPGHGKSTHFRVQMAWEVGNNPSLRCLYITDETDKSRKTVQAIKRMMRSPRYRALFPKLRVLGRMDDAEDSSFRFTITRENWQSREPTFEAASIMSEIQGNRYNRIYGDDFCPPEVEYQNKIRNTINQRWIGVVEKRIADATKSRIRVICTPWHPEDTAGIIEKDAAGGRMRSWLVAIDPFRIRDDKEGRAIPIWPERWTSDWLEEQKIRMGRKYDFAYRLRPATEGKRIVRHLKFYNANPANQYTTENDRALLDALVNGERWLSIDPAGTTGATSSRTGVVEIVLTSGGRAFCTDCWMYFCPMGEVLENLRDLILGAKPRYFGMQWEEAGAVKVSLGVAIQELLRQLKDAGYDTDTLAIVRKDTHFGGSGRSQSKSTRLAGCAGLLENGLIRFAGERCRDRRRASTDPHAWYFAARANSTMEKLTRGILTFTGSKDEMADGVDAVTQWLLYNQGRLKAGAPETPVLSRSTPTAPGHRVSEVTLAFRENMEEMLREMAEGDPRDEEERFYGHMRERSVA